MKAEIICVGDELLSGEVVNTNAAFISSVLIEAGIESGGQSVVGDLAVDIKRELDRALNNSDLVILSGGLGPTEDDLTKESVCDALGLALIENATCKSVLENYFKSAGRIPTDNNYKQTLAPKDAIIFPNDNGTACGMAIENFNKTVILLPGPPAELEHMFNKYVLPYLKNKETGVIISCRLNVFGMGESAIAQALKDIIARENPIVATYCSENTVDVKVTAHEASHTKAQRLCNQTAEEIKAILGDAVYGTDSIGLANVAVDLLREKGLKISTAESCTGGMMSTSITSVPRSSQVFEIGISAYSSRIKHEALSVPSNVLKQHGAISWQTAMYLAKNVRLLSDSHIGIGITGNAGPTADENKPIGLVYVAIADKNGYYVEKLTLSPIYSREKIRSYAVFTALNMVRKYAAAYPAALPEIISYEAAPDFDTVKAPDKNVAAGNFVIADETEEEIVMPNATEENKEAKAFDYLPFEASLEEFEEDFEEDFEESFEDDTNEEIASKFDIKAFFLSVWDKIKFDKTKGVKDIITKCIFIVSLIAFVVSAVVLGAHFISDNNQQSIISDARETYKEIVKTEADVPDLFEVLKAENEDIKAWITINNTQVDHPVYQTDNNDYYLNHNMNKSYSRYGALFFDYRNQIDSEGRSQNLTVYGHNMNNGSMFGTLKKYKSLSFYLENPTFTLTTPDSTDTYAIFSVMVMNATAADDNDYLYNFTRSSFASDEDFLSWIDESLERSLLITNVSIEADDEILTLVTCDDEKVTFENSRLVIMAKKMDENQLATKRFDAKLNPNPRYPQAWYDAKDLEGYVPTVSSESSSSDVSSDISSAENSSAESSSEGISSVQTSSNTVTSSSTVTSSNTVTSSLLSSTTTTSAAASSVGSSSSSKPVSSAESSSSVPVSSDASSESAAESSSAAQSSSEAESSSETETSSQAETSDDENTESQEEMPDELN